MSILINRVYTGVGDSGTTRLAGGQEVQKNDARIEAYGTIDELNAVLGLLAETEKAEASSAGRDSAAWLGQILRIQNELFDLGGELAVLLEDRHESQVLVSDEDIARLEQELDAANDTLPTLRSFVLPGGGVASAHFHVARTVCRRAERRLVALHQAEPQREATLKYLNRLSDWLFVVGRSAAVSAGHEEVLWRPGDRT